MAEPLINITRRQALLFAGFFVFYEFLVYIANDMIMPGMLQVVHTFHASADYVASSLTAYIMGGASLQLLLGPLSDRYGRRRVMLSGALFFLLCTIAIAMVNSIETFMIARFLQGMGLCFISVVGYATLQEIFSEMDAIRLIAIMASIAIMAPLAGPLAGAVIIHYYSWRVIFVIIAVCTFIDLLGLWRYMPESVGQKRRDGTTLEIVALHPRVIMRNYWELLSSRPFLLGSIGLGISMLPCIIWIALAPIILIRHANLSVLEYGLWQIPVFGAAVLGNILLHYLTWRFPVKKIIVIGSIIMGLGIGLMNIMGLMNDNFMWLIPGIIIYFLGAGVMGAPLGRWILFVTPVAKGTASAMLTIISLMIQAIGIECAIWVRAADSNISFGKFCLVTAILYAICLFIAFINDKATVPHR